MGDDVRLDEDPEALASLADSIAQLGVLLPLVVRAHGDGWEVVGGRRRLSAARLVGLGTVPCVVRDLDDAAAFEVTLAENLHRRDLSWIEVAYAYARLRDGGMNQQQIATRLGKSQTHVSHILGLLGLPQQLQDRVHRREIGYVTAHDLAGRKAYKPRGGGKSSIKAPSGGGAELATHWRRRHDRVIAGIRAMLTSRTQDDHEWRGLLERLLKLDVQPLDEPLAKAAERDWDVFERKYAKNAKATA